MKRVNYLVVLVSWFIVPMTVYSQESNEPLIILTIEEIVWRINAEMTETVTICWVDTKENAVELPQNPDDWFINASVKKISQPKGHNTSIVLKENIGFYFTLVEDSQLQFEFNVEGNIYPIGVWNGSKFAVRKNNEGKYILLPEETAKLSPPPIEK